MRLERLTMLAIVALETLACACARDRARESSTVGGPVPAAAARGEIAAEGAPAEELAADKAPAPAAPERALVESAVRAGEWDDNANYREFLSYINAQSSIQRVAVEGRRFIVVRDKNGKAVPNCKLEISDSG